jgi:hypothetical protein
MVSVKLCSVDQGVHPSSSASSVSSSGSDGSLGYVDACNKIRASRLTPGRLYAKFALVLFGELLGSVVENFKGC